MNSIFRLLGVPSLLEQYQNYLETTEFREPDTIQKKLGQILADAYQTVTPSELLDEAPALLICKDDMSSPAAFCQRHYEKFRRGILHRKYEVEKLILMRDDFRAGQFCETFMKYLDDACREHGEYETLRAPTTLEKQYLDVLRRIAGDIFTGFTCYDRLPGIRIIINRPLQAGSVRLMPMRGRRQKNIFGVSVRSEISSIQIRSMLLASGQFSHAVAIFMHELLHQFGEDGCAQFRKMIAEMCLQMMRKADRLAEYECEWEQIGIVEKETEHVGV